MPNQSITIESRADVVEKYKDTLPDGMMFTQQVTTDSQGKNYNPAKYDWILENVELSPLDKQKVFSIGSTLDKQKIFSQDSQVDESDIPDDPSLPDPPVGLDPDYGINEPVDSPESGGQAPAITTSTTTTDGESGNGQSQDNTQEDGQTQNENETDGGSQETSEPTNQKVSGGIGGVIAPEATDGDTSEAQERVNFIYEATLNQNEESSSDENSEDKKESKGLLDSIGVTKKQAAIGSAALLTGVTILSSGD